ncbi:MAG TPA: hypothetical protein VGC72_03110 [Candidatus Elarobacter sp.]|jgi:hypothetical protein
MLLLLPIIVALAANPTPSPAPAANSAARPTPLTEIGRVRALPACVPIVAHANGAINEALENDRTLAVIANNLHSTDFDALNFIQRRNAIESMLRRAEAITKAAKAGDEEVKRLREYAVNSPDPKRKEELKTFADALGGAIYRQKKAAMELQRDVAIVRGRENAQEAKEQLDEGAPSQQRGLPSNFFTPRPLRPTPSPDPLYDKHFKFLADKLDELNQAIMRDEGIAADHSIAATSGC